MCVYFVFSHSHTHNRPNSNLGYWRLVLFVFLIKNFKLNQIELIPAKMYSNQLKEKRKRSYTNYDPNQHVYVNNNILTID